MKRPVRQRVFSFLLLLIQVSAVGAYTLLDGAVAARANATVAHVEENGGGPSCVGHDESTCQLCRAGATSIFAGSAHVAVAAVLHAERPVVRVIPQRGAVAHPALRSRPPPAA